MTYVRLPPPTVEQMLEDFTSWMAQHAQVKVTVRIDYQDGTHTTTEFDRRVPRQTGKPKTRGEMRHDAINDNSCVGAFARAAP